MCWRRGGDSPWPASPGWRLSWLSRVTCHDTGHTGHVSLGVMATWRGVSLGQLPVHEHGGHGHGGECHCAAVSVSVWLWTRGRAARDCRAGGAAPRCPARTPVCPPVFLPHKFPGVLATVGPWPGTVVTLLDLSAGLREISKCVKAKGQSWAILLVSLC